MSWWDEIMSSYNTALSYTENDNDRKEKNYVVGTIGDAEVFSETPTLYRAKFKLGEKTLLNDKTKVKWALWIKGIGQPIRLSYNRSSRPDSPVNFLENTKENKQSLIRKKGILGVFIDHQNAFIVISFSKWLEKEKVKIEAYSNNYGDRAAQRSIIIRPVPKILKWYCCDKFGDKVLKAGYDSNVFLCIESQNSENEKAKIKLTERDLFYNDFIQEEQITLKKEKTFVKLKIDKTQFQEKAGKYGNLELNYMLAAKSPNLKKSNQTGFHLLMLQSPSIIDSFFADQTVKETIPIVNNGKQETYYQKIDKSSFGSSEHLIVRTVNSKNKETIVKIYENINWGSDKIIPVLVKSNETTELQSKVDSDGLSALKFQFKSEYSSNQDPIKLHLNSKLKNWWTSINYLTGNDLFNLERGINVLNEMKELVDKHYKYGQTGDRTSLTDEGLKLLDCSETVARYIHKLGITPTVKQLYTGVMTKETDFRKAIGSNDIDLVKGSEKSGFIPEAGDIFVWRKTNGVGHTGIVYHVDKATDLVTILEAIGRVGSADEKTNRENGGYTGTNCSRTAVYKRNGKALNKHEGWVGYFRPKN